MNIAAVSSLLADDVATERDFLHLTPNENIISETAQHYLASELSGRYNFGPAYGHEKFTLYNDFTSLAKNGLNTLIAQTEQLVNDKMGSSNTLFAPLSGLHSMMISILTTTTVGQTVFCLDPTYGGHFATTDIIQSTGRVATYIPLDKRTLDIDYQAFRSLATQHKEPYIVYLDVSYSLIPFDIAALKKIIGSNILIYDASHTLGLIMGGQFPNPLASGADIITANTHKTLPGSHKGMLLFANQGLYDKVNGPAHAYYSSTHINHTIALCIALNEMIHFGDMYAKQIVTNANLLGDLLDERGLTCRRADGEQWTYTHQLHLLIRDLGTVEVLAKRFYNNDIAVNFDNKYEQGHFIRLGLQEITRLGAGPDEIRILADIISNAINGHDVRNEVSMLKQHLRYVHYSFDKIPVASEA